MKYRILSILAVIVFCTTVHAQAPYGLLTDLLEHTETVYINGLPSSLKLEDIDDTIEPVQFAEIVSEHPTFSWIVPGEKPITHQTHYRIIVSDNRDDIVKGTGNVWDSTPVNDSQSSSVKYGGTALHAGKAYYWRVKTMTNTGGESDWSAVKSFRTSSTLGHYATSGYPLVKSIEYPVSMIPASGATFADFEKVAFGQLLVTLTANHSGDSVIIHLGEQAVGNRVQRKPSGTVRYQRHVISLLPGTHIYRIKIKSDQRNTGPAAVLMPDYIGEVMPFRYVEVENYGRSLSQKDIVREAVYYPFDESASHFASNNDTLNQIWEMCKYSIKATSFCGIYIDGDRERIPYEADALINQLCHYGVDREYSMARRSNEYLLERPTWPTEWILQAVLIAWQDYLYTGDERSLRANYDILKNRTLLQLRTDAGWISTTTGLQTDDFRKSIRFKGTLRDIVDWPHTGGTGLAEGVGGETDGFVFTDYNVVTNAFHYKTLEVMGKIAEVLDMSEEMKFFNEEASSFKERFNRAFFNSRKGYYKDGVSTDHASLHGNMMPLALGVVPKKEAARVADFIRTRGMACSVYGSQFLMDALYEAENAEYALGMLTKTDDRSWYNMIRVGSTISLEAWDDKYKPNQDWNHAWGAAPANIIPRKLLGIEPLTPGFGTARIKPQIGSLRWAKGVIPTIKGAIEISIENNPSSYIMHFTLPSNMNGELYLPVLDKNQRIIHNGSQITTERKQDDGAVLMGTVGSGKHTVQIVY